MRVSEREVEMVNNCEMCELHVAVHGARWAFPACGGKPKNSAAAPLLCLPSEGEVQDSFCTLAAANWLEGRLFSDSLLALGMSEDDNEAAPDRQLLSRASAIIKFGVRGEQGGKSVRRQSFFVHRSQLG